MTRLGFGSAPLGGLFEAVDGSVALSAIERALALGVRYFDTAPLYGFGLAEERLGVGLRSAPAAVISTKVGYVFTPALEPNPFFVGAPAMNANFDWSRDAAYRSVEESLARLGRPKLDIVLLHDPPVDELDAVLTGAYRALVELRAQGAIQAIGAGVNDVPDAIAVLERADLDCVLIAGRLTLLDQSAAPSLLPLCAERGVSVIVGGVFNSGVLADPGGGACCDYRPVSRPILQRVKAIDVICRSHGVPLAAAALQYPLCHSQVASVVPGMRSPRELEENLRLMQHPVPEGLWVELESSGLVRSTAHG